MDEANNAMPAEETKPEGAAPEATPEATPAAAPEGDAAPAEGGEQPAA